MKPETVHFRISRLEESLQVTSPSDQKKAIFMTQAFNLLILIFSIVHTGWVLNHIAIAPVKSWNHYYHCGFYKVLSAALFVSYLWFDKVLLVPAFQNRANTS